MSPKTGLILVSMLGAALLAGPVSARTLQPHQVRHVGLERAQTMSHHGIAPGRRAYLLERRGAASPNAFKHFDDQFILDP
jgi:hypothetical protein